MVDSPTAVSKSMQPTQTSSYVSTISPLKRKRRPAGTPDPDAEVIALSPKTLMESDRYVCEICNQGFQRDQNLQMHRRRHKVPWKLLKRADPEVRKRVYVCPEPSCLHHNPCHALGDLVGIKKHYRRKHSSMKQWECDKCFKAYAVQSDYKAHLKTCGTRGHCCDCGRVFSRVETFIEHQDTCSAASKKKTSAHASISDEQAALSLPSLATAAPASDDHIATFMPSVPSNAAEKVIKKDTYLHHHTLLMNLPFKSSTNDQESSAPASAQLLPYTHSACLPIPTTSAPNASFLLGTAVPLPHTLASSPPRSGAYAPKVPVLDTQQPGVHLLRPQHQKAELQLLPAKPPLSQLESSQSSNVCAWGKEITSTNSTTVCSSPCDHMTVDHEKPDLNISGECPSTGAAAAVPCKLQLSIGLIHNGHNSSCKEDSFASTLQMSSQLVDAQYEASDAEMLDRQASDKRLWLVRDAFPADEQQKNYDLLSEKQCGSFLQTKTRAEMVGHGKEPAISLELANSAWHGATMKNFETQKKQDHDALFDKKMSASQAHVALCHTDRETSKIMEEGSQRVHISDQNQRQLGSPESPAAMALLRCNSLSGMLAADDVETAEQKLNKECQTISSSRQIEEPGVHQQSNFSLAADRATPSTMAAPAEHAELCLERAKAKLKRALEEKLEAEKAWKEAMRKVEQAEADLARVESLNHSHSTGYMQENTAKHVDEKVVESIRLTHDNSSENSLLARSSRCLQVSSSSSLQMQVNAGGVITSSAPSFITCPSCHHIQVLYHLDNLRGTLFVPSQPAAELPCTRPGVSNCLSGPQPPSRGFNQY